MAEREPPEIAAIRKNIDFITATVSGSLQWFANKLEEKGFIKGEEAQGIIRILGIPEANKARQLLDSVFIKLRIPEKRKQWFDEFVAIFSGEAAYEDLVDILRKGSKHLCVCLHQQSIFSICFS